MTIQSINNIFPLIDDPANIFYSKIKQWFKLQSNFHLHCKAVSRVDRVIEASFMGLSRTYSCKFKTYKVLKEEDVGSYLYLRFSFVASHKTLQELTTSGESIPVSISDFYILEDHPKPIVLTNTTDIILYELVDKDTPYDKPHYHVYFRVNKVYKNEYSLLDIENTEIDYDELHFEDSYRPSVGRLWVLRSPDQDTSKHYCDADTLCSWELYNVDSENHYTLIDKSNTPPTDFNSTHIWPVQYGPSIDHRTDLVFQGKDLNHVTHPYLDLDPDDFWIEIRELEWSDFIDRPIVSAQITEEAEPYLNTRGHVPQYLPYLFRGIHFRQLSGEGVILTLSYVCNINIRYLLCRFEYPTSSTPSVIGSPISEIIDTFSGNDITAKDILNLQSVDQDFQDHYLGLTVSNFIDYSVSQQAITFTNLQTSQTPLKSEIQTALTEYTQDHVVSQTSDTIILDGFSQNALVSFYLPHLKWYIRQFVYYLSFLKYCLYEVDITNKWLVYRPFSDPSRRVYLNFSFFYHNSSLQFLHSTILNGYER